MLLDLVITRHQRDLRNSSTEEPVGKSNHVAIKFMLSVLHELPARASVKCYSRPRIEEIRRGAASIPWLLEHKSRS